MRITLNRIESVLVTVHTRKRIRIRLVGLACHAHVLVL